MVSDRKPLRACAAPSRCNTGDAKSVRLAGSEVGGDWDLVSGGGNTFGDSCGVLPDSLNDVGDLYSGASGEGNACMSAPSEQLDGAVLSLKTLSFGVDPVFVALE